jgi:hypothetical protein
MGLAAAQLMLERQEATEHPLIVDPETNIVHRVATPLSTPSDTNVNTSPATTANSLPSHYTIEVDTDDLVQTHPLEDWIWFDPDLHRTSTSGKTKFVSRKLANYVALCSHWPKLCSTSSTT